jgi:predicted nucleic acid-binding protein
MGVIVDTSTLVTAERRKHSVREIFAQLRDVYGEAGAGLSAVTVVELAHGIERAQLEVHRLGFEVVTGNVRHFEMIPDLVVKKF